jgi:oxygen-dependent protoporphyrinogen oxidase
MSIDAVARTPRVAPHLIIIGGGITGLAAAYTCAADARVRATGMRCTLIERETRLGGKLFTEFHDGFLVEHGADSFLAAKPPAAELCRALGLGDHLIGTTPGRAVYVAHRRRLHRFPEGTALGVPTRAWPIARTGLLSPAEKLRLLADLALPRREGEEDESIGSFLRRRLGDAAVTRLAGPVLAGIYAGDPDALSLRATFPQLLAWERAHRSLLVAGWVRRRQGRGALASPSPAFMSLTGGLGELVSALRRALAGHDVLTGRSVQRLERRAGSRKDGYAVHVDDGRILHADAVLLATPAHVTAALLASIAPPLADRLRAIPHVSTASVNLAFDRRAIPYPLDGHGFVVARGESLSITACTWVSSKWPRRAPDHGVLLRCYLGAAGSEGVLDDDDERLVRRALADVRLLMGVQATPVFTRVTRWPKAMPQYLPGHLERLAGIDTALEAMPALALAGASYRGVGIPDCVQQGAEAARRLADALAAQPVGS